MKMITVKLQGVEVQAALLSPNVMKKVEKGFTKTVLEIEKIARTSEAPESAQVRKQCKAVIDYVTDIFGADGAVKIFGGEADYLTCLDVLEEMQRMYPEQVAPVLRAKNAQIRANVEKANAKEGAK